MATYYIGPSGDDTGGDGSEGDPWLTITKAVASSTSGDTIRVLPGTTTWVNQDFGGARTLVGDNGDPNTTIFDAGGASIVWYFPPSGWTIRDLQFYNAVATAGIFKSYSAPEPTVSFERCIFRNLSLSGNISIIGQDGTLGGLDLLMCLFDNCTTTTGSGSYICLTGAGRDINITNCIFYSNVVLAASLSLFRSTTADAVMKNNIFYTGAAIAFYVSGTPVFTGSTNNLNFGFTSFPSIPNTLTSDPLFVDPSGGNFNLRPGSPAIDAGVII